MRTGSQTGNHHPAGYDYPAGHNYPSGNYYPTVNSTGTTGRPDYYPSGRYSARSSCPRNKDLI
jgi:hypothetical protein